MDQEQEMHAAGMRVFKCSKCDWQSGHEPKGMICPKCHGEGCIDVTAPDKEEDASASSLGAAPSGRLLRRSPAAVKRQGSRARLLLNAMEELMPKDHQDPEDYEFDVDKARHIYAGGPYGYVVYLGEAQGKIYAYDLDGGKFTTLSKLGEPARKSEFEDYESLWSKVGNVSNDKMKPYLNVMQSACQYMQDMFDAEKHNS